MCGCAQDPNLLVNGHPHPTELGTIRDRLAPGAEAARAGLVSAAGVAGTLLWWSVAQRGSSAGTCTDLLHSACMPALPTNRHSCPRVAGLDNGWGTISYKATSEVLGDVRLVFAARRAAAAADEARWAGRLATGAGAAGDTPWHAE